MSSTGEEVAANLYRFVVPIPVPFLDSINVYVVATPGRSLIVDPGMHDDGCMAAVKGALQGLGVDLEAADFFITHGHPDHFGLLGRLRTDRSVVYINEEEVRYIEKARSASIMADYARFLAITGFPERDPYKVFPHDTLEPYQVRGSWGFRFVEDGDVLGYGGHDFRCVTTPGHTGGHTCLYDCRDGIFLSGDHLLPDISPTIQLWFENENPLDHYLKSLDKVYEMDVNLVLPGHGPIFKDCRQRIRQLKEHHEARLQEILSALSDGSGKDTYGVASRLSWSLSGCADWDSAPTIQKFFATGEAFSHLRYLEEESKVFREMKGGRIVYRLKDY